MAAQQRGSEAQRVRACLDCGELVPFEDRRCPHCDYHEPLLPGVPGQTAGKPEPCPECGESVTATLVFCPRCGADRGAVPEAFESLGSLPSQASTKAVDSFALVLTLLGPLLMATAVLSVFAFD
ncbi:MAG: RNA polymerase subunit RPABC4/transcription elongation factor Spt4 [Pseudohongiellaceae bacterium]|jgi:RNA polymerase subunit RPABC4/transcription elongation factor Spt4